MESGKQQSGSGSSLASDLFGPKDASSNFSSSSSGIFASMFAPPNKTMGGHSLHASEFNKKNETGNQSWSGKTGVKNENAVGGEGKSQANKDMNPYYQQENTQPFHYSSSIYYGGQDVYARPQSVQNPVFTTFGKDGEDDNSGYASRGNWWQGSLYY